MFRYSLYRKQLFQGKTLDPLELKLLSRKIHDEDVPNSVYPLNINQDPRVDVWILWTEGKRWRMCRGSFDATIASLKRKIILKSPIVDAYDFTVCFFV
jgi:hypothetical protein